MHKKYTSHNKNEGAGASAMHLYDILEHPKGGNGTIAFNNRQSDLL